jgi:hypothetical protein
LQAEPSAQPDREQAGESQLKALASGKSQTLPLDDDEGTLARAIQDLLRGNE